MAANQIRRRANTELVRLQKLLKVGKVATLFAIVILYYLLRASITICLDYLTQTAGPLKKVNSQVEARTVHCAKSCWLHGLFKVGLPLVMLIMLWLFRQPLLELLALVKDKKAVVAYLQQFGLWGSALLMTILMLQVLIAAIPGHILMIAGAYVYGFPLGFLVSLISTVGASQCAFALARWAGRPVVTRLAPAHILDKWNRAAEQKGTLFFLFAFMLPIFPADVMNFVAGLSSISARRFLIANFFGRLPGVILLSGIGAFGFELSLQAWMVIIPTGAMVFLAWWYFLAKGRNITLKHKSLSERI